MDVQTVGSLSKPFAGEGGVLIVEPTRLSPAPNVADYAMYKTSIQQNQGQRTTVYVNEAARITNRRAKFY